MGTYRFDCEYPVFYAGRSYRSSDGAQSNQTSVISKYTLALIPIFGSSGNGAVNCAVGSTGVFDPGAILTFIAVNGMGTGQSKASSYLYLWDKNNTDPTDWSEASAWTSGNLVITQSIVGVYYLHISALNGNSVRSTSSLTIGPYLFGDVGPSPLGMTNKAVGGGQLNANSPGITDGVGCNNICLLVKTWGKVTYIDTVSKFFYIDDGSRLNDQSGIAEAVGLRVSHKDVVPSDSFTPPSATGLYVSVVGISSTTALTIGETTRIIPTICPRMQSDMQLLP